MDRITFEEAQILRKEKADVDKTTCEHKNILKEYYLGSFSDYVCSDCGFSSLVLEDFRKSPK